MSIRVTSRWSRSLGKWRHLGNDSPLTQWLSLLISDDQMVKAIAGMYSHNFLSQNKKAKKRKWQKTTKTLNCMVSFKNTMFKYLLKLNYSPKDDHCSISHPHAFLREFFILQCFVFNVALLFWFVWIGHSNNNL